MAAICFAARLELLAGHIARSAVRASALHSRHFAPGDERAASAGPVNHFAVPLASLGEEARALILKKGYRDEDLAEIAREAAIANGMSK